jgi:hypothetical protein
MQAETPFAALPVPMGKKLPYAKGAKGEKSRKARKNTQFNIGIFRALRVIFASFANGSSISN